MSPPPASDGAATRTAGVVPAPCPVIGVRIAGTGSRVPEGVLSNQDLERMMDTSDEWIVQRTGIRERRICTPSKGETTMTLSAGALEAALADASMSADDLDLIIVASVTGEMTCPATACRVAEHIGATRAAAFDVLAACCGWVYSLNVANSLVRSGAQRTVGVIGCDVLSRLVDYDDRSVSILFGDAAGAAILTATDETDRGLLASELHADGSRWSDLFIPSNSRDLPLDCPLGQKTRRSLHMNGRSVYKFAVGTFSDLIQSTLDQVGLDPGDVDMYVCHQSNARMLEAARKRFGLPEAKMYMNIDRYGNCSAGSVPLCLDELRRAGHCGPGSIVMFVAFGGGLTWASSLWRM